MVKHDGEQDCFHRIVVALVSGRLSVRTNAQEELVEMFLIFSPQSPAEFRPSLDSYFDLLSKRGNRAAHNHPLAENSTGCAVVSMLIVGVLSSFIVNLQTCPAHAFT